MASIDDKSPLIELRQAVFGYKRTPVVGPVDLRVSRGEFAGLIGPNGAGKSTLFKGMLRLLPPMGGEVIHSPVIYRRIGYVPQRDQLDGIYPLTALAVAGMSAAALLPWYQTGSKALVRRALECLERVGMENFRDHLFAELSGGQRQRILIARALAIEPQLLVLDEPTAGIDPVAEETVMNLLDDLHRSQGISILMVSHNIESLRHHVARVFLIKDHRVVAGSTEELLRADRLLENLSATL